MDIHVVCSMLNKCQVICNQMLVSFFSVYLRRRVLVDRCVPIVCRPNLRPTQFIGVANWQSIAKRHVTMYGALHG